MLGREGGREAGEDAEGGNVSWEEGGGGGNRESRRGRQWWDSRGHGRGIKGRKVEGV